MHYEVEGEDKGDCDNIDEFSYVNLGENNRDRDIANGCTQVVGLDADDEVGFKHTVEASTYDVGAEAHDKAEADDTNEENLLLNYHINLYDSKESIEANNDGDSDNVSEGLWSDVGDHFESIQRSAFSESNDNASSRYWNCIRGGIRPPGSNGNTLLCKGQLFNNVN